MKWVVLSVLCLAVAIVGGGQVFAEEMTVSGTNYWPLVAKASPLDPDRTR